MLVWLGNTRLGWRLIRTAVTPEPWQAHFGAVERWPVSLRGFDDLMFLFSPTRLNFGIAGQSIDEAAYLYRLVRELGPATIAEIGRYKGGSTFLIATAMQERSELYSYDSHVLLSDELDPEHFDSLLRDALSRYGLEQRVHLIIADSRTAAPPGTPCDLIFIDADHSYEGVRADYEHWVSVLRPGGHLLFHNAAPAVGYGGKRFPGVERLVAEIENTRDPKDPA